MLGNGHVPFLGSGMMATSSCYPTAATSGGTAISPSCCSPTPSSSTSRSTATSRLLPSRSPWPAPPLIALSTSEARHLLAHLFWPALTSAPLICQWSIFRRTHQYWAGYYHRRRRQKAG